MNNSILTNLTSMAILQNLNSSQNTISTTLQRLSNGIKLNQAKDGAANYCISRKLEYQLSGLDVATSNLLHGNNLLNTADNALEDMIEHTTKIRDLCLKAKTSTSRGEIKILQNEINQLADELERQRQTATYNDAKIFETKELKEVTVKKPYEKRVAYIESTGTQYIDTGYVPNENTEIIANVAFLEKTTALQQFGCITNEDSKYSRWHFGVYQNNLCSFKTTQGSTGDVVAPYDANFHEYYLSNSTAGLDENYKTVGTTSNSDVSFTLFARNGYVNLNGTSSVGYYSKSRIQDFKIYENSELVHSYIPVVDYDGKAALYDEVTKTMLYNQGSGEFKAGREVRDTVETTEALVEKEPTILQIGNEAGKDNTISVSLGFDFGNLDFDVSNSTKAGSSLKKIDNLISALTSKRANVGSALNRLESIYELQTINKINLSQTKSTLADADIAFEASKNTQAQILQEISASLLSQSLNITGGLALKLLGV